MSTPPVSTSTKRFPVHSQTSSFRSRVTPGISCTTAARVSVSRLTSVDLPTFGKPTIATAPSSGGGGGAGSSPASGSSGSLTGGPWGAGERVEGVWGNREVPPHEQNEGGNVGETWFPPRERAEGERRSRGKRGGRGVLAAGRNRVARPTRLVQVAQPGPEAVQLVLDLLRGLAVSLAASRQAVEAHRLAKRDGDRREVAELPGLRAVDRSADHGDVLLQGDHRCAGLHVPGHAAPLSRSLDEHAERLPRAHDFPHLAHGLAVGLAAPHRQRAERADQLAETRNAVRLDLGEEVEVALADEADARDVDPVEVVERHHEAAARWDPVRPVGVESTRQR